MSNWETLEKLAAAAKGSSMAGLFATDANRFDRFSARAGDMLLDYSKTSLTADIITNLHSLAVERGVPERRDAMFSGAIINETEGRAVLHTALRNLSGTPVFVDGKDVMPGVFDTLARLKDFSIGVRNGEIAPKTGQGFTDVVNIGIGGSDLGPVMVNKALSPYHTGPKVHFVSNIDGADITDTLNGLDPSRTLIIIASKSFTTSETMTNAMTAKKWLARSLPEDQIVRHLVALSTAVSRTSEFGVAPDRVFGFEDWVGGRYSVWGPIGLGLMLAIGPERFFEFLAGAEEMDEHFVSAPLTENLPVLLALTGIWHSNFCGYNSRAVLPYDNRLSRLPAYLQQLDMESNGKGVAMDGTPLINSSGPIVWGEPGTNGQHAFYQLIHQGTRVVPCEFLLARKSHEDDLEHHHQMLAANCLAQSEALMLGRSLEVARQRIADKGFTGAELERQAAHRVFSGNRPSVTLMYDRLDPRTLGKIIALYEHRVFVEGVIWGINSFDQWGVELGKDLANKLLPLVESGESGSDHDSSTLGLLNSLKAG